MCQQELHYRGCNRIGLCLQPEYHCGCLFIVGLVVVGSRRDRTNLLFFVLVNEVGRWLREGK